MGKAGERVTDMHASAAKLWSERGRLSEEKKVSQSIERAWERKRER